MPNLLRHFELEILELLSWQHTDYTGAFTVEFAGEVRSFVYLGLNLSGTMDSARSVFCNIGKRCKRIKFYKTPGKSDIDALNESFIAALENDAILKSMCSNMHIVMQQEVAHGILCDIEEEDEIPENGIVTVVLIPVAPSVEQNSDEAKIIGTYDVPYIADSGSQTVAVNGQESSLISPHPSTFYQPKSTIPYPAVLPDLTPDLKQIIETTGLFHKQQPFVAYWATHLTLLTDGNPTKRDYANYARTITDTYPELKGGKNGYDIIKAQLSTRVRNQRFQFKKTVSRTVTLPFIATLAQPNERSDVDDLKEALKKCKDGDDSEHVKKLLKLTFSERRDWILKDAKTVKDIINEYPQLRILSLVLLESYLINKVEEATVIQRMGTVIDNLATFFDVESNSEENKAIVVQKMYSQLLPKKYKNVKESLIHVTQSTKDLVTSDSTSPRLVLYTMEGGIAAAYIVTTGARIMIPEPTVTIAVIGLVAAYYAWHASYPPAYAHTLRYLELQLFNVSSSADKCVDKFLRDLNHKLAKQK